MQMSWVLTEAVYQLLKYRNLSSRETRMSVMRGGRVGRAQPTITGHSCLMTTLCTHFPLESYTKQYPRLLGMQLSRYWVRSTWPTKK